MKTYSIIVTVIAVLALVSAGYFYWQSKPAASQLESCLKDKAQVESQLSDANKKLTALSNTVAVFKIVNESFIVPGDLKAQTVGSQEATEVERMILNITDKTDRMLIGGSWSDFKTSLRLSDLFHIFRTLADNLERILAQ